MVIIVGKSFRAVYRPLGFVFFGDVRVNRLGYCLDGGVVISAAIIVVLHRGVLEFRAQALESNLTQTNLTHRISAVQSCS